MHVSNETNVELLRKKAVVLEAENVRLSRKVSELLREVLSLKGMAAKQIDLNLPALLAQASGGASTQLTKPGSERRAKDQGSRPEKKPQTGHGPTPQPQLPVIAEEHDLDEADKICPQCGDALEPWLGQEEETEVVDLIERTWVVRKATLKKYHCRCGGCVETAEGPKRLTPGGRYTPDVAVTAAVGKYLDQAPLQRQVRIAARQGARITTQTLWDQLLLLSTLLTPLVGRIKAHILSQPVLGIDESPFKLIKKGGSVKWQAWQMSVATALYFEILPAKSAAMGAQLLDGYQGVVMADGAKAYESLARAGPFTLVNCWSHARRKVLEAEGEAPGQVGEFVDLVGELYAIERKAVVGATEPDDRRTGYRHRIDLETLRVLRDGESRAVAKRIKAWITAQRCIPGGLLQGSLKYIAKRWTALTRFVDDPRIPLDNNRTEAGFVGMALGRRNYIGARSQRGTEVAAKFYTVFESARVCGVDPEAYLRYATAAILAGEAVELPHQWAASD